MNTSNFPRMHVSLYVSDIQKTVAFYNAFFNQKADKVKSDYAKYVLDKPSLIISFVQNPGKVKAQFGHLGFQVETQDELKQIMEKVKTQNLSVREEIGTSCCYAVQDKFWVMDPDGMQWEVYYFHEDAAFNDPHYSSEEATACCVPNEKKKLSLSEINALKNSTCC